MTDPQTLTNERKNQHGDWVDQANTANSLRLRMRDGKNWHDMPPHQREALDMIVTKISRILTGDPSHADHWDDIAGYAYLGKGGHTTAVKYMQDTTREEVRKNMESSPHGF